MTTVLAHAGGFSWDEGLLVMAPLALLAGLLYLANRRAARLQQPDDRADSPQVDPDPEDELDDSPN